MSAAHDRSQDTPAPELTARVRRRVFVRSLWLQACWNPRRMQSLGIAWALEPALKVLYPDPQALRAAADRHLAFFNCHPYMTAAILGGSLFHEQRIARGEEEAEKVVAFKASLMGPLAALGDGFFWMSLRPAAGAVGALVALLAGYWGVAVFLVGYNAVHLGLRAHFFSQGWRLGDEVVGALAATNLTGLTGKLRPAAAAAAGAAVAVAGAAGPGHLQLLPMLAVLGLGVVGWVLLGRGLSPYAWAAAAAGLAAVAGAFL